MCPVRVSRRVKLLWQISQANLFPITSTDPAPRLCENLLDRTEDERSVKIIKRKKFKLQKRTIMANDVYTNHNQPTLFKMTLKYERQCMKKF